MVFRIVFYKARCISIESRHFNGQTKISRRTNIFSSFSNQQSFRNPDEALVKKSEVVTMVKESDEGVLGLKNDDALIVI